MGLLRWLLRLALWILWPRRRWKETDEEPPKRRRTKRTSGPHPGVVRIEVDNELSRFHADGPAFSFWSSSRIILILSILLWWIQPAGPMIAGYVGGRRAGSPWKAVVAALLPVVAILVANYAYANNVAARQIDFVASLPLLVGDGVASVLPFLALYRDFMVAYLQSFVEALRTTFGMGTNGYLMVVLFAYIGGLIGEQTRRELAYRSGGGAAQSVGLHLPLPFFHPRPYAHADEEVAEAYAEDDEEEVPRPHRRPAHARDVGMKARRRRGRHGAERFEDLRKLRAETVGVAAERRRARAARRADEDDEDGEEDEDEAPERVHARHPAKARGRREREEEEPEPESRPAHREPRPAKTRSREEELAIQRFVERALRNYDHSRL